MIRSAHKGLLWISVFSLCLVLLMGCIRQEEPIPFQQQLMIVQDEKGVSIFSRQPFVAMEISLSMPLESDLVIPDQRILGIPKIYGQNATIALVSVDGAIPKGQKLLFIPDRKRSQIRVTDLYVIPVDTGKKAVQPFSNGISVQDLYAVTNQLVEVEIWAKGLPNVGAIDLFFHFDPDRLTLEPNPVSLSGGLSGSLLIPTVSPGTLKVSVAASSPVNLNTTQKIMVLRFRTSNQTGTATIQIGSQSSVLDGSGSPIAVAFHSGTVSVSGVNPVLLGDFNGDQEVGLADFHAFAQKYGSQQGDGRYDPLFDIGPAEDRFGGQWAGIFDHAIPDQAINLMDFIVFANNYGKKRPVDDHPPSAPAQPDPPDHAQQVSVTPILSWMASTLQSEERSAVRYDVYLDTTPIPVTRIRTDIVSNTTTPLSTLSFDTEYYWQVVAKSEGGETAGPIWRFKTQASPNQPPTSPTNPNPVHQATQVPTQTNLSWTPSTDPDGDPVSYRVFMDTQPNPTTLIRSNLSTAQTNVSGLQYNTTYYWKVEASDGKGGTATGGPWSFQTQSVPNNPPTAPANPNPANNASGVAISPTLTWTASTDPDGDPVKYDLYLGTSSTHPPLISTNFASAQHTVSNLAYSTTYYWKVVAKDNKGGVTSSPVWSFTTLNAPSVQPTYRALIIGASDYGGNGDLPMAANDAEDIKTVLTHLNTPYQVQTRTGWVTKAQIDSLLDGYASQNTLPQDVFLFHYSGHGDYSNNQSYLYLADGSIMRVSDLRQKLQAFNGTKIVLIDACLSGAFVNLTPGREPTLDEKLDFQHRFMDAIMDTFIDAEKNRSQFNTPHEFYVLTGSSINQYAWEDSYLKNGFFSFFFADGMGHVGQNNPNGSFDYSYDADGYGPGGALDGSILFHEIYHYSRDKVLAYSTAGGEAQTVQGFPTDGTLLIGKYTISQGNPPSTPSNPTPSSGSTQISTTQSMSWTSSGATSYDIYFGTSSNPPKVSTAQAFASFNPGQLNHNTKYYWRVEAINAHGRTSGPVWNFTTVSATEPSGSGRVILKSPTPEIHGGMTFSSQDAAYDSQNPTPPHWVVQLDGYVQFGFQGKTDFRFTAAGKRMWGYNAEIDVWINGQYFTWAEISTSWIEYSIAAQYFSSGSNTVRIYVDWGNMWIDEAWVGEGTTPSSPPSAPASPNPSNGASIQSTAPTLSWTSSGATAYDVYFGTASNPPKVSSDQSGHTYSPGTLNAGSTYYWKIVAKNAHGTTTGSIWNFTVASSPPPGGGPDFEGPVYSGRYILVSNESSSGASTGNTGTLSQAILTPSVRHSDEGIPLGLPEDAYRINPIRPLPEGLTPEMIGQPLPPDQIERATVGSTRQFWTFNFVTNSDQQITATLQAVGTRSEVWVQNPSLITTAKAQQIASEFDNNIYPKVTQYFAIPSNVSGTGRISILCYDIQDGFTGSGGYIAGYFWPGDLFPSQPGSNGREIFHIDTYPLMHNPQSNPVDVTRAFSTIAHEFQHMVNFNRNYIIEQGERMDTWLDEALSMAAEHLIYGPLTSRISYYNNSPSIRTGHSLLYWDSNGEVLANYALSYLFMQYVRTQAGIGNAIFKEIIEDSANDYRAVENAVKKYISPGMSFGRFMTHFRLALMMKESTGLFGFKGEAAFNAVNTPLYTGGSRQIRGGGAVVKEVPSGSFTDPGNAGPTIQYVGVP